MSIRYGSRADLDLQGRKSLNVADGTERTDGVNLGQLQDATGPGFITSSNVPPRPQQLEATDAEGNVVRYTMRVTNNTDVDTPAFNQFTFNSFTFTVQMTDNTVPAFETRYYTFNLTQPQITNLINTFGSRTANELVIRYGTGANEVDVTVLDDVGSEAAAVHYTFQDGSSGRFTVTPSDTGQPQVVLTGGDISEWRPETDYFQGQILFRHAESTVDGEVVASAGGLFYSVNAHTSPATFSDNVDLVPIPLTEVEWTAKLFDPRGFYETGDLVTTETGENTGIYQVWIHSGAGLDGRVATNGIPPENRPDGTNSSSFWQLLMQGGGGTSVWPVYADTGDASTNTQSFASSGGEFIAFYRSSSEPTLPIRTGISFVDYVGDNGAMGDQGPQGRFFIRIFRRFAGAPTNPTLGSYDADTGVLTPPTDWFLTPPSGSDTLYVSDTTIDPSTMTTGAFVPSWSPAVQAGGTGPAGPDGTVPLVTSLSGIAAAIPVSYTHLRAHETPEHLVCRLLLEKKKDV